MLTLQFYTRKECALCDAALAVVKRVQRRVCFNLEILDIDSDPHLSERYGTVIPVVTCGENELARSFIDEKKLGLWVRKLAF